MSRIVLRGLPEPLPAGERVLWQGAPSWGGLARRVFHVRKVVLYCSVLLAWRVVADLADGATVVAALGAALGLVPFALTALAILAALAWAFASTTVYTITSRRVVMRYGVALPMTLNLPFARITGAGLRLHPDGSGDLPLTLAGPDRIAYLHLWPHARPWRVARPEPMLRAVPKAGEVAALLADAMVEAGAAPTAEPAQTAPLASAA